MKAFLFSTFVLAAGFSAHSTMGAEANTSNFDESSVRYIKGELARIEAVREDNGRERIVTGRVLKWLTPFYSDLTPYRARPGADSTLGNMSIRLRAYFKSDWLPGVEKDGYVEKPTENVGFRNYRRVPNTICPVVSEPNGNPVGMAIWEHQKDGIKITALIGPDPKTEILLVVHKDAGFGDEHPTADSVKAIAVTYFHLPPKGLIVPEGWKLRIQIDRQNGRFASGSLRGEYSGVWPGADDFQKSGPAYGGSWEKPNPGSPQIGSFYYDGFNLAIHVTPVKGDRATIRAAAAVADIDWDKIEKHEDAEKAKPK